MAGEGEFKAWPKIPRLRRGVIISEKIDGTNAIIWIADDRLTVKAGSRSRWLRTWVFNTEEQKWIAMGVDVDNFGFALWVGTNLLDLLKLGPGYHYGEWWGKGIQRGYGLEEKRFSLFNADRWKDPEARPACCHVVPILARGTQEEALAQAFTLLASQGSVAAPGFMDPEGVVVYHTAARSLFKVTCKGDETAKGE